ncbi:MAG: hypothetical protein ABFD92_20555 [Planctomycetaceae bacterium]|nr:hypothetical protein [Planctomycetaceae bacterium]
MEIGNNAAWYALRRTLPPWRFEENLQELVECAPRYGIDEVIVVVDTEEFTHGQPPLGWIKRYMPMLQRAADELRRAGIVYSLNPWITVGHCDRARDDRKTLPGLQTMVGDNGVQCTSCACPLDSVWRKHTQKIWTLYAKTRPHVVWVEDDIRTFNHEPIQYGCFCPIHMARFSTIVGSKVTREQLLTAVLAPGRPHPWRKAWLDMQRDAMNETVAFLTQAIHRVSPQTCIGLMSSHPRNHVMDGRDWKSFCDALAGGRTLYSRPPMGNYSEGPLRGFYYSHDSIKITRACCPAGTIEQTEVEKVPFTRYANSSVFTFLEMAVSFAYGCQGVTMNLFDHVGTPMEEDASVGRMLGSRKPFLNALAAAAQRPGMYRGVRLLHRDGSAYVKRLAKGKLRYGALGEEGAEMGAILESLGVATTYETDPAGVTAVSGQSALRACTDDEIRQMLAGGMYIDAVAAGVLVERGFGKEIGLTAVAPPVCIDDIEPLSAEEFHNTQFGGREMDYMTLTLPDLMGRPSLSIVKPAGGAQVLSHMVDPDRRRRYVGMTAFENALGGRVVVHALALGTTVGGVIGEAFFSPTRQRQILSVMDWLSRGRLPLVTTGDGVYPLAFRKDCGDTTLLGMFNLSLDPWPAVQFGLADSRHVASMKVLGSNGKWSATRKLFAKRCDKKSIVRFMDGVSFNQPLFVQIRWV